MKQTGLDQESVVLGIETSCDDTSIALVSSTGQVLCSLVLDQNSVHGSFSGVVPEMAGRQHLENLIPLLDKGFAQTNLDWECIQGIAVTQGPGLVGCLLVGILTAETLALTQNKPLIGINHLEGHVLAPFLKDKQYQPSFEHTQPFLALTVSGGHTALYKVDAPFQYELLGSTVDDAAGEAFDKLAVMLGLGFPGGGQIDQLAQMGDSKAYAFPRPLLKAKNFSFSGLKTAALRLIESLPTSKLASATPDICASYQEAIVDVLLTKLMLAVQTHSIKNVVITGGVSANRRLRTLAQDWADGEGLTLAIPPLRYCTDNGAMIGWAGALHLQAGHRSSSPILPKPVFRLGMVV